MSDAAALMDRMYRRQRHIYDLSRKFYLLGRDEGIARLRPASGDKMLEIGCGTGRNLVKLAQAYPEARLIVARFPLMEIELAMAGKVFAEPARLLIGLVIDDDDVYASVTGEHCSAARVVLGSGARGQIEGDRLRHVLSPGVRLPR